MVGVKKDKIMRGWVVQFGCNEAVYREGTKEEVNYPDDLGCQPLAVYPIEEVNILSAWDKNGEFRVKYQRMFLSKPQETRIK